MLFVFPKSNSLAMISQQGVKKHHRKIRYLIWNFPTFVSLIVTDKSRNIAN